MTNINLKTILMLLLLNASQILAIEKTNEQLYQELQEIKTTMNKMGHTLNAVALKMDLEQQTYEPEILAESRLITGEKKRQEEEKEIKHDGLGKTLDAINNVSENIHIPNINALFFGNSNSNSGESS